MLYIQISFCLCLALHLFFVFDYQGTKSVKGIFLNSPLKKVTHLNAGIFLNPPLKKVMHLNAGIVLNPPLKKVMHLNAEAFSEMKNLSNNVKLGLGNLIGNLCTKGQGDSDCEEEE